MGNSSSSHVSEQRETIPSMATSRMSSAHAIIRPPPCVHMQENAAFNSAVYDNEAFDHSIELPPEVMVAVTREGSVTVQLGSIEGASRGIMLEGTISAAGAEGEGIMERGDSIVDRDLSFFSCRDYFDLPFPESKLDPDRDLHQLQDRDSPASFHTVSLQSQGDSSRSSRCRWMMSDGEIAAELLRLLSMQ